MPVLILFWRFHTSSVIYFSPNFAVKLVYLSRLVTVKFDYTVDDKLISYYRLKTRRQATGRTFVLRVLRGVGEAELLGAPQQRVAVLLRALPLHAHRELDAAALHEPADHKQSSHTAPLLVALPYMSGCC